MISLFFIFFLKETKAFVFFLQQYERLRIGLMWKDLASSTTILLMEFFSFIFYQKINFKINNYWPV
jgi:hypothetical protein